MPALILLAAKWVGLLGMAAAAALRLFGGAGITRETHFLVGMASTFLFMLSQVMTIYYFIGMSRALREAASRHPLDSSLVSAARANRSQVSRPGYVLALLAAATLVAAGGALSRALPLYLHWLLGAATIAGGILTAPRELRAFRTNAALFDRAAAQITARPDRSAEERDQAS